MVFKKVANKLDVESGGVLRVEVNNREISLFNIDGDIYAIDEICSHADGPLSEGYLEGYDCLLYTSPSPRDGLLSRMPSSA